MAPIFLMAPKFNGSWKRQIISELRTDIDSSLSANFSLKPGLDSHPKSVLVRWHFESCESGSVSREFRAPRENASRYSVVGETRRLHGRLITRLYDQSVAREVHADRVTVEEIETYESIELRQVHCPEIELNRSQVSCAQYESPGGLRLPFFN